MKHHLVKVVIGEHYLIVFELVEHAAWHLSTCIHYIGYYVLVDGLER